MWDEVAPDSDELADTVLALVRDAGLEPGDEPWLGALALPDEDGELAPAGELVLPGSPFAEIMREGELAFVDAELADRWGEQPLAACGVLVTFALVRATDVVLDPDELEPRDSDFAEPDDPGLLDSVDVWSEDVLDRFPDTPVPPSPPNWSPSVTWTSSTTTAGPRPSPSSPSPRSATRSPSRSASCCPMAPTRSYAHTRPGGCAATRCSTAAARRACSRPAATRSCAVSTTRPTRPASTTNRYSGPSASAPRSPPSSTSPAAPPNSSTASPTPTARSPAPNCTPCTARWPTSTRNR